MPTQRELANAVRALSMDAVQRARSGHPGAPMGMADIIEVLWNHYLQHNPADPDWPNRDRFVMSNGHGSMLLYAVLHLSGYEVSMEDIKQFRQLRSKTPGHPECDRTPGVETTTGPLGQGLANAVGMAIAERILAAQFNRPGYSVVAHHTWFSVGDGCLMEGISHEACSLAGTLGLGKLIGIYDRNQISIDGAVQGWFTEDVAQRFAAYGWQVLPQVDGHDAQQLAAAFDTALADTERPSLIPCDTVIGWGAPGKQGTAACHGAPLGEQEVQRARETLRWPHEPFHIPQEHYAGWDGRGRGAAAQQKWEKLFEEYAQAHPRLAQEFRRRLRGELPAEWPELIDRHIQDCAQRAEALATRKASQNALNAIGTALPELLGGSADLSGSNLTQMRDCRPLSKQQADGNYLYYGVREFAMAAIGNGLALHGGFIPYSGTFLMFSEYSRNALRMAALMGQRNIFVFTHDSIGLGEDGPTHQAVEQAACLRLMPNMSVWRPADAAETAAAWRSAIERRDGPSSLLLSRQTLPHIERDGAQLKSMAKGGYILREEDGTPDLILIATGSELHMAVDAGQRLRDGGHKVRVVSMPCTDLFDQQEQDYRDQVLPPSCRRRIAVEAGIRDYWRKYVGMDGAVLGLSAFGESAPAQDVYEHFGITTEKLVALSNRLLSAPAGPAQCATDAQAHVVQTTEQL